MSFPRRVIAQFQSSQNLAYLRDLLARHAPAGPGRGPGRASAKAHVLATLHDALLEYSSGTGRALEVLASDPRAQRGARQPSGAVSLWGEVRRLNYEFYKDRRALLRELSGSGAPSDEPYHLQMFAADSLHPVGLEHLNEAATSRHSDRRALDDLNEVFLYGDDDAPWSRGCPDRTPEQALAEYWGDDHVETELAPATPSPTGRPHLGHAYGKAGREDGGTRFMRREAPPFWQLGGRGGYDYDIGETLGSSSRELDGQVRGWGT